MPDKKLLDAKLQNVIFGILKVWKVNNQYKNNQVSTKPNVFLLNTDWSKRVDH